MGRHRRRGASLPTRSRSPIINSTEPPPCASPTRRIIAAVFVPWGEVDAKREINKGTDEMDLRHRVTTHRALDLLSLSFASPSRVSFVCILHSISFLLGRSPLGVSAEQGASIETFEIITHLDARRDPRTRATTHARAVPRGFIDVLAPRRARVASVASRERSARTNLTTRGMTRGTTRTRARTTPWTPRR